MSGAKPEFKQVSLERRPSNVFVLTLRKAPENRLDAAFCQEIISALRHAQDELGPDAEGALVTTSFSEKYFCTGLDLDEVERNPWSSTDGFYPMLAAFLEFPYPTVACVTGHSFGGGCPLALAHDYRVMNSKRGFWSMPPVDLGIHFHGIGALPRLKCRPQIARQMLLEAHRWTGEAAHKDGIVDTIAPPDKMLEEAVKIAEKWAVKAKMGVYGILRNELYGEASEKLRSISYIRSRDVAEKPKAKI